MKEHVPRNKVILALKRAIEATFDDGRWRELGYLTDTIDLIERHPRLLRSLYWGDPDYPACILQVLPQILGDQLERLEAVEKFVGLERWLRENDPDLYGDLYDADETVPLDRVESVGKSLDVSELNQHAARIRHGIRSDPAHAIGAAKELLETVLKTVLGIHGVTPGRDIPELLKLAQKQLGLDPKSVDGALPGADTIRRILSNLGQVVVGVAEIRNLYGTGHGRSKSRELEISHARLVVNAAITLATFLLELWEARGRN